MPQSIVSYPFHREHFGGDHHVMALWVKESSTGGGVVEWLGHWTCNLEVPGSSLSLSATLVNSQLVSLPLVGVFKMFMFHLS